MTATAPLAGIAPDFLLDRGRTKYTVLERYPAALREAGLRSVVLVPDATDVEAQLDLVDGVVLAGGDDLDTALWGAAPPADLDPSDPRRTAYEWNLAHAAMRRRAPLLGICLGLQLLNVACGGSLRKCPAAGDVAHRDPVSAGLTRHAVTVVPGTRLARAVGLPGGGDMDVDSQHRWAPDRLGEGLVVAARSADGVVEAAELGTAAFCLAVQWHPEASGAADARAEGLFRAFSAACAEHRAARLAAAAAR